MTKKRAEQYIAKENEKLVFKGYRIVDQEGNLLGTDPSQFPELIKKCAEVIATIRTGKIYKVIEKEEDKL